MGNRRRQRNEATFRRRQRYYQKHKQRILAQAKARYKQRKLDSILDPVESSESKPQDLKTQGLGARIKSWLGL